MEKRRALLLIAAGAAIGCATLSALHEDNNETGVRYPRLQ
jgi:hypothetical protein